MPPAASGGAAAPGDPPSKTHALGADVRERDQTSGVVWVAIGLAVVALALVGYIAWQSRRRDTLISRSVAVHTQDDRTLRGVLVATYDDWIVLRNAAYVEGSQLRPLAGAQHVPLANVSFVQELVTLDAGKLVDGVDVEKLRAVAS